MEKDEKELLDELKNFDIKSLFQKGSYIDFFIQHYWTQGYIIGVKPNNRYDVSFLLNQNQTQIIENIPSHNFSFFGENTFRSDSLSRGICFNIELYNKNANGILHLFKIKLRKTNIELNYDLKEKKKKRNQKKELKENNLEKKDDENKKNKDEKTEKKEIDEKNKNVDKE